MLAPCTYLQSFMGLSAQRTVAFTGWNPGLDPNPICESNANDLDAHLMLRVQRGDVSAVEQLVERYKQPVTSYAARTLGDPIEAEDIAQNAFVRVFRASGRFRFEAKFSSWVFTITRNLCLNELRRRSRHRTDPLEQGDDGAGHRKVPVELVQDPVARENLLQSELLDTLDEAMATLPERERTAILLLRETEISYEDIARVLGTTVPATKALIHHGRKRLKRMLRPYLDCGRWREPVHGLPRHRQGTSIR
ncbi:MAG TPA: RNA polymerase sigma factor [Verrucomicrobiae bacterium]|nr:RNA polymerase sigma factor [Verrucomicrobiae bacterium]